MSINNTNNNTVEKEIVTTDKHHIQNKKEIYDPNIYQQCLNSLDCKNIIKIEEQICRDCLYGRHKPTAPVTLTSVSNKPKNTTNNTKNPYNKNKLSSKRYVTDDHDFSFI